MAQITVEEAIDKARDIANSSGSVEDKSFGVGA
jgi:hypothetical protein